jgi:hypothetical protein
MATPNIPMNLLYPIDPKDDINTNFDVVFFHELQITKETTPQEGYKKTWTIGPYIHVFMFKKAK